MRDSGGAIRTAFRGGPVFFALGRYGAIAVADVALGGQTGPVRLLLVDGGSTRVVATRPPQDGGAITWSAGRLAWTVGWFLVRAPTAVELIVPATGATVRVTPPQGCGLLGVTDGGVLLSCADHLAIADGQQTLAFGSAPLNAQAFPRAIVRSERSGSEWIVTPILIDEPRSGPPPRF